MTTFYEFVNNKLKLRMTLAAFLQQPLIRAVVPKRQKTALPWFMLVVMFINASVFSTPAAAREIVLSDSGQYGFARDLYRQGEYYRAISEYKRLIHFFPGSDKKESASLMIGFCYYKGERWEEASNRFSKVYQESHDTRIKGTALFMQGEVEFQKQEYSKALALYRKATEEFPDNIEKSLYKIGRINMQKEEWEEAKETLGKIDLDKELKEKATQLVQEIERGKNLPRKSPGLAGALAILPGLGHVYCERYQDAMSSFLLNGIFITGAVASFSNEQYIVGGIMSFFELGWYLGNIYSATSAAHKFNRYQKKKYFEDIDSRLGISISPQTGGLSLSLSMNF